MKDFLAKMNWVAMLGVVVAVEMQIGNGSMSLDHMIPADYILTVKAWMGNLGSIGALIMSVGAFGRVPGDPAAGAVPSITPTIVKILIAAFLLSTFLFVPPATAQTKLGPIGQKIKSDIDQTKAVVTGQPADPTAPIACGFKMFVHLTPDNLEQTVKNCVAKANSTLIADVKGAFDSAKAYNNGTGDADGLACLRPGLAIVQAAAFTPYIPEVPAVLDANGVVITPKVPAVESKEPGLVTLFQKYREFTLAGGLTACQNWINQPTQLTAAAGVSGLATVAGAALLLPK